MYIGRKALCKYLNVCMQAVMLQHNCMWQCIGQEQSKNRAITEQNILWLYIPDNQEISGLTREISRSGGMYNPILQFTLSAISTGLLELGLVFWLWLEFYFLPFCNAPCDPCMLYQYWLVLVFWDQGWSIGSNWKIFYSSIFQSALHTLSLSNTELFNWTSIWVCFFPSISQM